MALSSRQIEHSGRVEFSRPRHPSFSQIGLSLRSRSRLRSRSFFTALVGSDFAPLNRAVSPFLGMCVVDAFWKTVAVSEHFLDLRARLQNILKITQTFAPSGYTHTCSTRTRG